MFEEVLAERTYGVSQVRKVLVTGSRLMQKAVKKIDRYYNKTLIHYPELMTTDELIKTACRGPIRDDYYISRVLQPLQSSRNDAPSLMAQWYRKAYKECVFPSSPSVKTAEMKKEPEDKGLFIKTEVFDKLDESIKKKGKAKKVKPLKNDSIFKL